MINVYRSEDEDTKGCLIADGIFPWHQAIAMIESGNFNFGRQRDVAKRYKKHLDAVKNEWDTVESFCRHKFLNMEFATKSINNSSEASNTQGKIIKYVTSSKEKAASKIAIVENDFRYALTPDIGHYTIWSEESLSTEDYAKQAEEYFPPSEYDVIVFENPTETKSVHGVPHAQIFSRRREVSAEVVRESPAA